MQPSPPTPYTVSFVSFVRLKHFGVSELMLKHQMCLFCNDAVDYTELIFFDCPTIPKFWNYIEQFVLITFDT